MSPDATPRSLPVHPATKASGRITGSPHGTDTGSAGHEGVPISRGDYADKSWDDRRNHRGPLGPGNVSPGPGEIDGPAGPIRRYDGTVESHPPDGYAESRSGKAPPAEQFDGHYHAWRASAPKMTDLKNKVMGEEGHSEAEDDFDAWRKISAANAHS